MYVEGECVCLGLGVVALQVAHVAQTSVDLTQRLQVCPGNVLAVVPRVQEVGFLVDLLRTGEERLRCCQGPDTYIHTYICCLN